MIKKRFLIFLLIISLILPFNVFAMVKVNSYVSDYADILSSDTEQYILNNSTALNNATGAQIVVVTVESLDGESIEEYANELFNTTGIGDKDKDNGLLILVSLNDRECRIEVGDGLEGALNDAKTGRIQDDYMIPYMKNDDFDNGILNGYKALFKIVADEYGYDTTIEPEEVSSSTSSSGSKIMDYFVTYLFAKIFICSCISSFETKSQSSSTKWVIFGLLESVSLLFIAVMRSHMDSGTLYTFLLGGLFLNFYTGFCGHQISWYGGGGWSSGGSSGGGHSSGGFSGGGGHSSGGGSSRHF